MIVTTTENVNNIKYEVICIVEGSTVQSKHIGSDIASSFKTIVGGEIKGYTDMMNKARQEAYVRMVEEAEKLNADAVVGVRYTSSAIMQGASEILAYGTAVKFL